MQHLRTALTPLVQKCQQMYIQCMHQKLYHLTAADYEDFVNIVCAARTAFQITPEGSTQFKEWLQSIRRSKSCKKDLWTQINAALQANSKWQRSELGSQLGSSYYRSSVDVNQVPSHEEWNLHSIYCVPITISNGVSAPNVNVNQGLPSSPEVHPIYDIPIDNRQSLSSPSNGQQQDTNNDGDRENSWFVWKFENKVNYIK